MAKLKAIFMRLFQTPSRTPVLPAGGFARMQAYATDALLVHDDTPEHERGEW